MNLALLVCGCQRRHALRRQVRFDLVPPLLEAERRLVHQGFIVNLERSLGDVCFGAEDLISLHPKDVLAHLGLEDLRVLGEDGPNELPFGARQRLQRRLLCERGGGFGLQPRRALDGVHDHWAIGVDELGEALVVQAFESRKDALRTVLSELRCRTTQAVEAEPQHTRAHRRQHEVLERLYLSALHRLDATEHDTLRRVDRQILVQSARCGLLANLRGDVGRSLSAGLGQTHADLLSEGATEASDATLDERHRSEASTGELDCAAKRLKTRTSVGIFGIRCPTCQRTGHRARRQTRLRRAIALDALTNDGNVLGNVSDLLQEARTMLRDYLRRDLLLLYLTERGDARVRARQMTSKGLHLLSGIGRSKARITDDPLHLLNPLLLRRERHYRLRPINCLVEPFTTPDCRGRAFFGSSSGSFFVSPVPRL